MADPEDYDSSSEIGSFAEESDSEQESLLEHGAAAVLEPQEDSSGQNSTTAQASKAIEAAEEGIAGPAIAESATSPFFSPGRAPVADWADEQTPLLDAGPAPPDYAAATAWRMTPSTNDPSSHEQPLVGSSEDASWQDFLPRIAEKKRWKKVMRRCGLAACLIVFIALCVTTVLIVVLRYQDSASKRPESHYPDNPWQYLEQPEKFHTSTEECNFDSYSAFFGFNFEDRSNFTFIEMARANTDLDLEDIRITGLLEIRPAPYWQEVPIDVWFNAATTWPWIVDSPETTEYTRGLEVHFPRMKKDPNRRKGSKGKGGRRKEVSRPCLDIWIRIFVAGAIDSWDMRTTNLDIDIGPRGDSDGDGPWRIRVANKTRIITTRGKITTRLSSWYSREMHIETESGPIKGTFDMGDELSFKTQSGDIQPLIRHAKVVGDDTDLSVNGVTKLPSSRKHDLSGKDVSSKLTTSTQSGVTSLVVLRPSWAIDYRYFINSSHTSASGFMDLNYNTGPWWSGEIESRTVNGTIKLKGKGIEMLSNGSDGDAAQYVRAKRGAGNCRMMLETTDGDVEVRFGRLPAIDPDEM